MAISLTFDGPRSTPWFHIRENKVAFVSGITRDVLLEIECANGDRSTAVVVMENDMVVLPEWTERIRIRRLDESPGSVEVRLP